MAKTPGILPTPAATHAISLYGTPKYGPDFRHFDYVNPQAPMGGTLNAPALGSYEKFNPFILKGLAADGLGYLVFETLAVPALDEPDTLYGLLAKAIIPAPDGLSVTFQLNPAARFSNGDPVTAQDVKYSFEQITSKQAGPIYRQVWADVKQIVVIDALTLRADFKRKNHELKMTICQIPVFSAKWGQSAERGETAKLARKPFDKIITDLPIASGPYLIESYDLGKTVTYRRNPNYWGNQHPTRVGMFNFERIRYRYYKDTLTRMEALKAGEIDLIQENSSKNWARSHQGPKWRSGELIKTEFAHSNSAGWQGFVMNQRRPLFQDIRVRQALWLAMDFEWMNRQLFFNLYRRSPSYFTNTELAAQGLPSTEEIALLRPLQQQFPAEFAAQILNSPVPVPPTTLAPNSLRDNLRLAKQLLAEAGWRYSNGALRNAEGMPFKFEMMLADRMQERASAPYARNLEKLGITMSYRVIDAALYQRRQENYDFDMTWDAMAGSQSPGSELITNFGSGSALQPGSSNLIGVQSKLVDALIEHVLQSKNRTQLITACRALDRVLRHGYYIVPHFYSNVHRVSFRQSLAQPAALPRYYRIEEWSVLTWWHKQSTATP
ncbi:ABC transporter substrate-binding protein [Parvibium lacunae]|uniref:ABC transporter substrate-binding protein n=2 Tax=Parvibium lacunae TaxID=1888893 RepID=A0A368L8F5_9BURK|nr:ABC transporter substrate-binding protein [Parvibium lacunae]